MVCMVNMVSLYRNVLYALRGILQPHQVHLDVARAGLSRTRWVGPL